MQNYGRLFLPNLSRSRRGSAAMEFALILPIFAVMMCGTFQYGVLFYTWNVALNGARNAARSVAVGRINAASGAAQMRGALPAWVRSGGGSAIDAQVTDAAVGGDVVARLSFPSRSATFVPLAPMPDELTVEVRMVKEA
jgi:Flp pilus assembly protein TadG